MYRLGEIIDLSNQDGNERQTWNKNNEETTLEFYADIVSAVNHCQSSEARRLCIFDIVKKLQKEDKYDIGGTYTNDTPNFEFFFTTTVCPSSNCILNLFVCHRNIGSFKISISNPDSTTIKKYEKLKTTHPSYASLPHTFTSKVFKSAKENENHFIRSFHFSDENIKELAEKTLCIPIAIEMGPKQIISEDVLMWIKKNHNLNNIFKVEENTDINLVSGNGTSYATHKLLLTAHSPVFREMIKNLKSNTIALDINDDDMKILLEFMYTGTVQDIVNKNWQQVLELAGKFQIDNLCKLTQVPMQQILNKDNAVNIAILSEKYKLDEIQKKVFDFIKKNPAVLDTEDWNNLKDVVLTKKLLKEVFKNV